jgi:hypothetical protein
MCMTQTAVISGTSIPIHYGSYLALWYSYGTVLSVSTTRLRRMWRLLRGKSRFSKLPVPLLYAKILTEIRSMSLAIVSVFCVASGVGLDRLYLAYQHVNPYVSYRMDVLQKWNDTQYQVREIDPKTNLPIKGKAGEPHGWFECPNEQSRPRLEVGMRVDVTVEDIGCESFLDQNNTGWTIVRDEATGKFVDFRSELWTTPTMKQSQP